MYYPISDKEYSLAWDLRINNLKSAHSWSVKVDASNGTILHKKNRVIACTLDHLNHSDNKAEEPEQPVTSNHTETNDTSIQNMILPQYVVFDYPVEVLFW